MWLKNVILFIMFTQLSCTPHLRKKSVVLFTCPRGSICYASPPNCLNNCNAALSMTSDGDRITTFNVTMLSPLSYTAVLVKEQGEDKFETAIICSFHTSKGIVAAVNYPMPIFSLDFIDTTKPEGHTDSTHTQCSTTIFNPPPPANARFKLISGRWQDVLVIDENLAIDVVPAVENARILSTNKQLVFPTPKSTSFRASEAENIYDDMISENLPRETTRNVGRSVDAVDDDVEYEDNNIMSHMGKKRRKVEEDQLRFKVFGEERYDDDNKETDDENEDYNSESNEDEKYDDNYKDREESFGAGLNDEHDYEEHDDIHDGEHEKDKDGAAELSKLTSVIFAFFSLFYCI